MANKKLIEVALPLEKINEASAREKSIRHGHPSTLHLWWARRPLAAARAVIWASLVDDPSSHPELFPTEESQNIERQRLFKILSDLVEWENSNNQDILNAAKAEILRSTNGNPPALLDPFAGGGAIPLEAQRLGLKAYAHDLNPVAIMINKAMIEIPPRFANMPPVNPESKRFDVGGWKGAEGLAEDVKYYGEWMKQKAFNLVGHLYPKVKVPESQGGGEATVIAWIWTRTVKCPNPRCGCHNMPLASSFILSKKKGAEAFVVPEFDYRTRCITYKVKNGPGKAPECGKTSRGANFKCIMCGEPVAEDYIKNESREGRVNVDLMATVAEGKRGRLYISPDDDQRRIALCKKPEIYPDQELPYEPRAIWCYKYGLNTYDKLFTDRQLTSLITISSLLTEVQAKIETDSIRAGIKNDHIAISCDGSGALAYSQAICVYLAFAIDRLAMTGNTLVRWNSTGQKAQHCYSRQGLPMLWDFAETNFFGSATGSLDAAIFFSSDPLSFLPASNNNIAKAELHDAQSDCGLREIMVSTDPPYYDNIGYADLSDFFYVWLRQNLKGIYPDLFKTMLVPKAEELIASPYRHDGKMDIAKQYFEDGMKIACRQINKYSANDIPVTIYYAYKQTDSDEKEGGQVSSGWETMINAIIQSGFTITGTWPMRTEMATRQVAMGTNALSSSIILVCRKRPNTALSCTRRTLINELRKELRIALQKLQASNIAPVDLAQSSIGPGIAVFSRYNKVLEADGTEMSVRSALKIINQELDLYFNEQVGDLDAMSRFCIDLYAQSAFNNIKFGEADVLARAKGTSVDAIASHGPVFAKAGIVHLIEREQLPDRINHKENCIWMLAQQLTQLMATGGVDACAKAIYDMMGSNAEKAKDLAYRLYTIAEQKKWANEAYAYNSLVVAWPDIQARAAELNAERPEQMTLFDY